MLTDPRAKLLVAALSVLQLLPAACLALSAYGLVVIRLIRGTSGEASAQFRREMSSRYSLPALLAASSFGENMLEERVCTYRQF